MTEKLVLLFYFFRKHKAAFGCAVVFISVVCFFFASRIKLQEDITQFLPHDAKTAKLNFALENLKIKDKIIVHIYQDDSLSEAKPLLLENIADNVADTLKKEFQPEFINDISIRISEDAMMNVYDFFYNHLPSYLDEKDYLQIEKKLTSDSINKLLKSDYKNLITPSGIVFSEFIRKDPLNIVPIALMKIQSLHFDENFEIQDGYIFTKNKKHLLIFITPSVTSTETGRNEKFINGLLRTVNYFSQQNKNIATVEAYGTPIISTGNAMRAKTDAFNTTTIALLLIIILLLLYFRNKSVIIIILLPVAFGAAFSLCILHFLKNEISSISLGAGSVILGLAINYSLHFFTHYKHKDSVETVIRDLSKPMLFGCITTVLAFLSLVFVRSGALHDFGLFVGFSLTGAVLFTIIILPHLLYFLKPGKNQQEERHLWFDKIASYRLDKSKSLLIILLLLTIFFAYKANDVQFNSNMQNINYQTEQTTRAEEHLNQINQYSLASVYLIVKGKNLNDALQKTEENMVVLEELKSKGIVKQYASVNSVLISDSVQKLRINYWNNFWQERKNSVKTKLIDEGRKYSFKEDAFSSFYDLLNKQFKLVPSPEFENIKNGMVKDWINEKEEYASVVTMVKINEKEKQKIYNSFKNNESTIVFDRQTMTSELVKNISSDFNLILVMTSLIVFGFMLLSYGRIELAVINFLPMVISWIWILGIMAVAGLKFNIINIIISTFIFGLGDDYSIFIMNGLHNEYKTGNKNLESFKSSIFLSAIITTIGIGALVFAKHPALSSIASITIFGMITVVFISFIIQPLLYNFLILDRVKKKLEPLTLLNLLLTSIAIIIFCSGCFFLILLGLIIYLLPAKSEKRKFIFHKAVQFSCNLILEVFIQIRKKTINEIGEDFSEPAIIISNHRSHLDLGLILRLHPKIIAITNDRVWNSVLLSSIVRMGDFYPASKGLEEGVEKFAKLVSKGYSILIFPEGTRSDDDSIHRFHKGAFLLAEKLQIDLLPILIHGSGDSLHKGDFYLNDANINLKILPRISLLQKRFGESYQDRAKCIQKYFIEEFNIFDRQLKTPYYFRKRILKNYIYKGPLVEYELRKELREYDCFNLWNDLIPRQASILELGCGYGFMSYILSLTAAEREITGVDIDNEMIQVAANGILKTEKINFIRGDYDVNSYVAADAIILRKNLVKLKEEKILFIIEQSVLKLNEGGMLIADNALANFAQNRSVSHYEMEWKKIDFRDGKNFAMVWQKKRM